MYIYIYIWVPPYIVCISMSNLYAQELFWKRVGSKKAPRWHKSGKDKKKGNANTSSDSLAHSSSSEGSLLEGVEEPKVPEESAPQPELPSLPSNPSFPVDPVAHKPVLPHGDVPFHLMERPVSPSSFASTIEDLPEDDFYLPDLGQIQWPDPNAEPPLPVDFSHLLGKGDLFGPAALPSLPKSPCSNEGDSKMLKDLGAFLEECSQWPEGFETDPIPPCAAAETDHLEGNSVSKLAFPESLVQEHEQELTGSQAMCVFFA